MRKKTLMSAVAELIRKIKKLNNRRYLKKLRKKRRFANRLF